MPRVLSVSGNWSSLTHVTPQPILVTTFVWDPGGTPFWEGGGFDAGNCFIQGCNIAGTNFYGLVLFNEHTRLIPGEEQYYRGYERFHVVDLSDPAHPGTNNWITVDLGDNDPEVEGSYWGMAQAMAGPQRWIQFGDYWAKPGSGEHNGVGAIVFSALETLFDTVYPPDQIDATGISIAEVWGTPAAVFAGESYTFLAQTPAALQIWNIGTGVPYPVGVIPAGWDTSVPPGSSRPDWTSVYVDAARQRAYGWRERLDGGGYTNDFYFDVIDWSEPGSPFVFSSTEFNQPVGGYVWLGLHSGVLWAAGGAQGGYGSTLRATDVSNDNAPVPLSATDVSDTIIDGCVDGDYAWVLGQYVAYLYDIRTPSAPAKVATVALGLDTFGNQGGHNTNRIQVRGDYVIIAGSRLSDAAACIAVLRKGY